MEMKLIQNKYRILAAGLLVAAWLPAAAQYDQDIDVEGKYTPEYIAMDRIGMFPKPVKFAVEKSSLAYTLGGVDAAFIPNAIPAVATGWNDTRLFDDTRGYIDLGLGSWLNSTLSAGYRIVDTQRSTLGVRLQHNSTSLWKQRFAGADGESFKGDAMQRYDESIGVYGSHKFDGKGRLDAAVDYHLGYFNYYGSMGEQLSAQHSDVPTQTLNDVSARVGWTSPAAIDNFSWYATAGVRYFGFRRAYAPSEISDALESEKGGRETDVTLCAGLAFPTSSQSTLGLDVSGHLLTYDGGMLSSHPYGAMTLTPYYRFNRVGINIRIGAEINLMFNARDENGRTRTFSAAPSIKIDYKTNGVAFFLNLLGGNRLHTLANLYARDYYMMPAIATSKPEYTPIDGAFGINFGPFSGFHAGVEFDFRATRDVDMLGWYTAWLNPDFYGYASDAVLGDYVVSPALRQNLSGCSVALNLGYDAGRWFKLDARATYQHQSATHGYFNGIDRPEWTVGAKIESNPWKSLKLSLGCDLRGGRGFTLPYMQLDHETGDDGATTQQPAETVSMGRMLYKVPNWFSLNFGASYDVTNTIGVWIQADNLSNRENYYAPGLQTPGITLSAGVSFRF